MAERVANLNHVLLPGKPAPSWGRAGILRVVRVRTPKHKRIQRDSILKMTAALD